MTFSEKLFKLRKEKNLSQELLAEKLGTTRQAVSKWENEQGFPETEKLLMLSNIFEVSIDFLLKDSDEPKLTDGSGYYVSKEMADAYLLNEKTNSKKYAFGISIAVLAFLPYLLLKENPAIWIFITMIIVAIAFGIILFTGLHEDEQSYRPLQRETLLFDAHFLKELKQRNDRIKKKTIPFVVMGLLSMMIGGLSFLFVKKGFLLSAVAEPYAPICVVLVAIGLFFVIHTFSVLDAYDLLANNEKYAQSFGRKLRKKIKYKVDHIAD